MKTLRRTFMLMILVACAILAHPILAEEPVVVAQGKTQFLNLPARDRAAIQQSQSDPYPEEYAPAIEQYMRNLAAQSSK